MDYKTVAARNNQLGKKKQSDSKPEFGIKESGEERMLQMKEMPEGF